MKLPPPVVALSPGDLEPARVRDFVDRARRARAGGLEGLLLREARLSDRDFAALAAELRQLFPAGPDRGRGGAWLGIHDRAHLAPACAADGLHLGFRSLRPGDVPASLRAGRALGLSTHAGDRCAREGGPDYVFHGPVRPTPSKEGWCGPVGFDALAAFAHECPRPVWAIGGMRPEDVRPALGAGARGVAVLSGILGARDPEGAARAYGRAVAVWEASQPAG